jgi:uncharacterized protein YdiU (UPF0061 family)
LPPTFERPFLELLPGDPEVRSTSRTVHGAAWSRVAPTPVSSPRVLAVAREVAELLDIDPSVPDFASVFGGNSLWPGMDPYAACYGGHQFGRWAGQLGDGRAIVLGECVGRYGVRYEVQLKGAGPTPYSRHADGRAVLRSSVREFLCSEAMFHLGVPTTRALCLVGTGDDVLRDMFYDGRAAFEPGAIVTRVAPSFLRFGSYELPAIRGDVELLRRLVEHTLTHHYPHLGALRPEAVVAMFAEVADRTLDLVLDWMRVGFVHGVMNTDNLSILGLTVDYGPYGWLEPYDPDWTPNTTDASGRRYAFGAQPTIALWNLARLAEALAPLVGETSPFEAELQRLNQELPRRFLGMMCRKLGWMESEPEDAERVRGLFRVLEAAEVDWTLFFRALAKLRDPADLEPLWVAWYSPASASHTEQVREWTANYLDRCRREPRDAEARSEAMNRVNPLFVCRNYLAQQVIDRAAGGDASGIAEFLEVLRRPYDEQPDRAAYAQRRPEWARTRAGCSMLSCSS